MKRILFSLVALSAWCAGFAQESTQYPEFPSAREIQPGIRATVQAVGAEFQYIYALSNGPTARQQICQFIVTVQSPEAYGLLKEQWDVIKKERRGMLQVDWGSLDSLADVMPGGNPSTFTLQSVSPPGIVPVYAAGLIPPVAGVEQMEFAPGTAHILYNSVKTTTVGPVAPAEPFHRLVFIDSLSSLVAQARALGWIGNDLTVDKYRGLLAAVRSQLTMGDVRTARTSLEGIMHETSLDSALVLSGEAYALVRFNAAYLLNRLLPSREIAAGLFIVSAGGSSTLLVKAKPSIDLLSGDSLILGTVTLRWPARFNVSLEAVSSSYGFAAVDTPITAGSYRYQKFAAAGRYPLSWVAGGEYELFSVTARGLCGAEEFTLTNDITDGAWYVIVDYVDKTDSLFYSPMARAYAFENRSNNSYATYANGQRHLVRGQEKLHEVYCSGGEVIYRRSNDDGATWDLTTRVSSGSGWAGSSTVASGANGMLYIVWERTVTPGSVEVRFSRSSDNGQSWSSPLTLPGCAGLVPGAYQAAHVSPVLAELSSSTPRELIVAFADQGGLKYQRSLDQGATWMNLPLSVPPTVKDAGDGAFIWSLSMAQGSTYLVLTYDYRMLNSELVSRIYTAGNGWSSEAIVCTATGTTYDRHSSVAVDDEDRPVIAWCAQKVVDGIFDDDYRIMLRKGTPANSWSTFFVELPKTAGTSDLYPSVGVVSGAAPSSRGQQTVFQRSNGEVRVVSSVNGGSAWTSSLLGSSGQWPSASLERQTNRAPKLIYTDLTGASGLYPVVVASMTPGSPLLAGLGTAATGSEGMAEPLSVHTRTVVLEDPPIDARLVYGLGVVRCISAGGDTTALPFRPATDAVNLSASACWDYLGTAAVTFPADVQSLLVEVEVHTEFATADTAVAGHTDRPVPFQRGEHLFNKNRGYQLELVDATGAATVLYEDTQGSSRTAILSLPAWVRGRTLSFRLEGTVSRSLSNKAVVGVGDILMKQ